MRDKGETYTLQWTLRATEGHYARAGFGGPLDEDDLTVLDPPTAGRQSTLTVSPVGIRAASWLRAPYESLRTSGKEGRANATRGRLADGAGLKPCSYCCVVDLRQGGFGEVGEDDLAVLDVGGPSAGEVELSEREGACRDAASLRFSSG